MFTSLIVFPTVLIYFPVYIDEILSIPFFLQHPDLSNNGYDTFPSTHFNPFFCSW